jgi:anti-sigma regulatory factor (Ser/Thr protein kinase)
VRHEAQFPAVRTSALNARRFVSEAIADVPGDVCDSVTLIASELASNSVRHAASGFEIRIERHPDRIQIEVEDDGGGEPVLRSPGPTDTSGRGLQIVTALADAWGVIPKPDAPGKTVWAMIILRTTEDAESRRADTDALEGHRRRSGSGPSESSLMLRPLSTDRSNERFEARLSTGRRWIGRRARRPVTAGPRGRGRR